VSSSGVVTSVRDPPRVVRDENERVKNESDGVVDRLGGREGLMTALVSCIVHPSSVPCSRKTAGGREGRTDDPNSGENESLSEPVSSPGSPLGRLTSNATQHLTLGPKRRINEARRVPQNGDHSEIRDDVDARPKGGTLKAVSGDGPEDFFDGEIGNDEGGVVVLVGFESGGFLGLRGGGEVVIS
jgi:hypothetical protein